MKLKTNKHKTLFSFFAVLLFVYIILFGFILPVNKILPKPSVLIESIPVLFGSEYNFISAILFTYTILFAAVFISYFLISWFFPIIKNFMESFPRLIYLLDIKKYLLPFFLIIFFELWFQDAIYAEFIFILIIVFAELKTTIINQLSNNLNGAYINSGKSLGLTENELNKKVIWKSLQPSIFETIHKNYIYYFGLIILYEFICKVNGIGLTLYTSLKYNDLSLIVLIVLVLLVVFWLNELILKSIKNKFFFWK
ncbi:MAG: hypothetical protein CR986_09255 [Ignavibacteriae bacterium]|nr:MAG: hypothetical protein CR986_09255 [Ignavibacteriota bacterium]